MSHHGVPLRYLSIVSFPDVNECLEADVCKNGGTCFNLVGSFYCQCPPGFDGETCEKGKQTDCL